MDKNESTDRMGPQSAEPDFSLLGVLRSLWQWRRPIIITTLVAAIGSVIISLMMTVYFMAETRFLAINPDQANPDIISGTIASKTPLYGNMNDIDRLLAIAESNELVDFLVVKYDLYAHYDIDTSDVKASTKVRRKFHSLYEVTKTPKDAILIEVEDRDPVLAANLANDARDQIDEISRRLIKEALGKTAEVIKRDVETQQEELNMIADSLRKLREEFQLYDLSSQMEVMTTKGSEITQKLTDTEAKLRAYRKQRVRGSQDSIAKLQVLQAGLQSVKVELDSQLNNMSIGMEPMLAMIESRIALSETYNEAKQRQELFENALQSNQSLIAILETAQPPVIKSRPKRMFIVLGATFVAFLLSVLGVLAIENGRQFDWKKITD